MRKKAEITLYIYLDSITRIENRGTNGAELIEYTTTKFEFNQWESLATNHLDVNSDSLIVNMHVLNGSAEISGYSTYAQLYANGVTSITNKGFTCQTAYVNNSSLKDIYVSAQDYMFAFIGNEGNIFYNQENVDLKINIQGQGVVIFADF